MALSGDHVFVAPGTLGSLLEVSAELARRYETLTTVDGRKQKGQFFTPSSIAAFMAEQLRDLPRSFELLDAGAGVGMLTVAVCERVIGLDEPRHVAATLYEIDQEVLPFLKLNLEHCAEAMAAKGHWFEYRIRCDDFILDNADAVSGQPSLFSSSPQERYDIAIINPPYYKLSRNAPQVAVMEPVVHGQPNVYALFMAMAASLLREGGQLVAITPRSYCNGLYFRQFRRWFFRRMQPRFIHVFGSRTDAFQEDGVLQENIILACDRVDKPPAMVRISRSKGRTIRPPLDTSDLPYAQVVDNRHGQMVICIPEQPLDVEIAAIVDRWPDTFSRLGFSISTGPVVSFRAREFLVDRVGDSRQVVPMLWLHNVKPFEVRWPLKSNGKAASIETSGRTGHLLVPTKNYVLVKRFSAKEEKRRMTAGALLAESFPWRQVGIENHLNYVYRSGGELSVDEAFGLAGLFNSALLDRYFRTMSGNTQVNATEIRTMPLPSLDRIRAIGRALRGLPELDPTRVEEVVLGELGVDGPVASALLKAC